MVSQLVWPFKTRRILGHGSFGVVIEAEHRMKLDLNYAVKIIPSSQIQSSEMSNDQNSEYQDLDPKTIREAQNWSICDHKNIVKCYFADKFSFTTETMIEILNSDTTFCNILDIQMFTSIFYSQQNLQ